MYGTALLKAARFMSQLCAPACGFVGYNTFLPHWCICRIGYCRNFIGEKRQLQIVYCTVLYVLCALFQRCSKFYRDQRSSWISIHLYCMLLLRNCPCDTERGISAATPPIALKIEANIDEGIRQRCTNFGPRENNGKTFSQQIESALLYLGYVVGNQPLLYLGSVVLNYGFGV